MNSKNYLTTLVTIPAIALGATLVFSQSSRAEEVQNIQVVCNVVGDTPTVIAQAPEGESNEQVTLLRLLPQYFESPEMAKSACENTAQTLDKLYSENQANYLTVDVDDQSIVCAVGDRNSDCGSFDAQVLFKFKPVPGEDSSIAYNNMLGDNYELPPSQVRTLTRMYTDIQPRWWEVWLR